MPDQSYEVLPEPFPARTRNVSGVVNGVQTDVMSISFADKILITISQGGRLAHWVHVPLDNTSPDPTSMAPTYDSFDSEDDAPSALLPMPHLTATTVLGGTVPERDTVGQLFATQIASAIATKNSEERRMVVVGMGFEKVEVGREGFMGLLELVMQVI